MISAAVRQPTAAAFVATCVVCPACRQTVYPHVFICAPRPVEQLACRQRTTSPVQISLDTLCLQTRRLKPAHTSATHRVDHTTTPAVTPAATSAALRCLPTALTAVMPAVGKRLMTAVEHVPMSVT